MIAGAALTAAFALGALPGIAGSAGPTPASVVDPSAFQSVQIPAFAAADLAAARLDATYASAGGIDGGTLFTEPGTAPVAPRAGRPRISLPASHSASTLKPPRYKLTGVATFYAHGTTAMRL